MAEQWFYAMPLQINGKMAGELMQNRAVKDMIASIIKQAKSSGIKIGLCGQAPSDFPEFASFLAEQGIGSISFNPDALLKGIENINKTKS